MAETAAEEVIVRTELQASFRAAMGNVAAPVAVVTTHAGGVPHGTTVSAFASLSMTPPMLLVSLQHASHLLSLLDVGTRFGVNVLAAHQSALASRFATRGPDKFTDVPWVLNDGAPALLDTHAWVALRVARLVRAGDHTLVLGDVVNARTGHEAPLTYHRRSFGTHLAH
ncbi:MAG: flavin reductase family protein [Nocardioidaceae bacterium]